MYTYSKDYVNVPTPWDGNFTAQMNDGYERAATPYARWNLTTQEDRAENYPLMLKERQSIAFQPITVALAQYGNSLAKISNVDDNFQYDGRYFHINRIADPINKSQKKLFTAMYKNAMLSADDGPAYYNAKYMIAMLKYLYAINNANRQLKLIFNTVQKLNETPEVQNAYAIREFRKKALQTAKNTALSTAKSKKQTVFPKTTNENVLNMQAQKKKREEFNAQNLAMLNGKDGLKKYVKYESLAAPQKETLSRADDKVTRLIDKITAYGGTTYPDLQKTIADLKDVKTFNQVIETSNFYANQMVNYNPKSTLNALVPSEFPNIPRVDSLENYAKYLELKPSEYKTKNIKPFTRELKVPQSFQPSAKFIAKTRTSGSATLDKFINTNIPDETERGFLKSAFSIKKSANKLPSEADIEAELKKLMKASAKGKSLGQDLIDHFAE